MITLNKGIKYFALRLKGGIPNCFMDMTLHSLEMMKRKFQTRLLLLDFLITRIFIEKELILLWKWQKHIPFVNLQ